MTKQIKKTSGQMSKFRKLSIVEMAFGWLGFLLVAFGMLLLLANISSISDGVLEAIAAGGVLLLIVGAFVGISQTIEGRYYGDVFGKLTRKNTTTILIVFIALSLGLLLLACLGVSVFELISMFSNKVSVIGVLAIVAAVIMLLASIGHTITSTLIVAKAK